MKNIDYKKLKRYDIGKQVINNGYQNSTQSIMPTGYIEKPISSMDNAVSGLNMQTFTDLGTRASTYGSIFSKKDLYDFTPHMLAVDSNVNRAISSGLVDAKTGFYTEKGVEAALKGGFNEAAQDIAAGAKGTEAALKGSGQSVAKGGLSTAGKAAAVAGAAYGAFNTTKDIINFYTDYTKSNDIQNMSGSSINYIGNVPYKQYTGFDAKGIKDYTKKQNINSTINTTLDAAGTGASVGSLFGGYGALIGGAIGLVGGGLSSLFGWKNRQNKVNDIINNTALAQQNWNTQSESEGMSQAMRNQYNATHADKGLSPNYDSPNALVQGGEPIIALDKKTGEVKGAKMFPITKEHPERVDNIPVKLDQGNTTHGVLGNKIDPFTGERLAVEGRPYVAMTKSSNPNEVEAGKQGLKELLNLQDLIGDTQDVMYADQGREPDLDKLTWVSKKKKEEYKMTRANKQDMLRYAKSLPKYDGGTPYLYSILPGAIGASTGLALYYSYKKDKPTAATSYTPNTYAQHALDVMPKYYDPTNELYALNNTVRQAKYNNRVLSAGQRMLMDSLLYNNYMLNKAAVLDNAAKQTAQYKSAYAQLANQIGEQEAARRTRSNELYNDQMARAIATRRKGMETGLAGMLGNLNSMFGNLNNNYWTDENIGLYRQKLRNDQIKDLATMSESLREYYNKHK